MTTNTETTSDLELIKAHVAGSIAAKRAMQDECHEAITDAAKAIAFCMQNGGKLLLCGNGGSAADCQHIAAEFVSVLNQSFLRPGLASIALTTDTSILTASANDFGFDGVFARQVQAIGKKGDVVIGISTSGNSENVYRALQYARENGMLAVALTGRSGGKVAQASHIPIQVPASVTQYVEECHIAIGHIICALVERQMFPEIAKASMA